MKIGLFSDIHGNSEAFERILAALKKEKVKQYVFLGDLVGYGASPKECIVMLKALQKEARCHCIAGNHDYAVCGLTKYERYSKLARESIDWTRQELSEAEMKFLAGFPLVEGPAEGLPFTIVHANLAAPGEWGYIWDIDDADLSFRLLKTQVCFIGHSHKPIVFTSGKTVDWFISDEIELGIDMQYMINIGSVGQPRDGNPLAAYAVYDSEEGTVRIKRVAYDIKSAQEKILKAGLPRLLADRLAVGK